MSVHERSVKTIQAEPDPGRWDQATREHARECTECASTAQASATMRDRLRKLDSSRASAPASLRQRLARSIQEDAAIAREAEELQERGRAAPTPTRVSAGSRPRAPRAVWPRWAVPSALAAGLALGVGLTQMLGDGRSALTADHYLDDVTHDRYLLERTGRPLELEIAAEDEASRWLSHGLGIDVRLPESPEGWRLEGVRVWHTLSRLSAMAVYADAERRRIVVFAVPVEDLVFEGKRSESRGGRTYFLGEGWDNLGVVWREGELAWAAVADMPAEDLLAWIGRLGP